MSLGKKIRLNESKSGFKDGNTKAWVAVQEWQRDALALVSQNDAGEVLRIQVEHGVVTAKLG